MIEKTAVILRLISISKTRCIMFISLSLLAGIANSTIFYILNQSYNDGANNKKYFLIFITLLSSYFAINYYIRRSLLIFAEKSLLKMRLDMIHKVMDTSYAFIEKIGKERIFALLTRDMNILSRSLPRLISFSTSLITTVAGLVYLYIISVKGFFCTLAVTAIGTLAYYYISRDSRNNLVEARRTEDVFLRHVDHVLSGAKELKINLHRRTSFYSEDFQNNCEKCYSNSTNANLRYLLSDTFGSSIFYLYIGLISFVFSSSFTTSNQTFLLLLIFLMGPFSAVISSIPVLHTLNISTAKLYKFGNTLTPALEKNKLNYPSFYRHNKTCDWKYIKINQVCFKHYNENKDVNFRLGPIEMFINKGEIVFIIGQNGSGKSTLAKLICGLYVPTSGNIEISGELISNLNREEYRQLFSAVFSNCHLFDKPYGIAQKNIQKCSSLILKKLMLPDNLINTDSYTTAALSRGQRERLALATSYLEDREIYLFDEWASHQDPSFKEYFYLSLLPALKIDGKTVIAVTHDDRYNYVADKVVTIENGQIV